MPEYVITFSYVDTLGKVRTKTKHLKRGSYPDAYGELEKKFSAIVVLTAINLDGGIDDDFTANPRTSDENTHGNG